MPKKHLGAVFRPSVLFVLIQLSDSGPQGQRSSRAVQSFLTTQNNLSTDVSVVLFQLSNVVFTIIGFSQQGSQK